MMLLLLFFGASFLLPSLEKGSEGDADDRPPIHEGGGEGVLERSIERENEKKKKKKKKKNGTHVRTHVRLASSSWTADPLKDHILTSFLLDTV